VGGGRGCWAGDRMEGGVILKGLTAKAVAALAGVNLGSVDHALPLPPRATRAGSPRRSPPRLAAPAMCGFRCAGGCHPTRGARSYARSRGRGRDVDHLVPSSTEQRQYTSTTPTMLRPLTRSATSFGKR